MSKRNQRKRDRRAMSQHTDAAIKRLNDAEDRFYESWFTRQTGKAPPPKPQQTDKETP